MQSRFGEGLNKLQDSLQQGKQKLHTAQEMNQFKKVINETSEKRAEIILKLGEMVYKKIRLQEISDPELTKLSQDLFQFDQQIFRTEVELGKRTEKSNQHQHACSNCHNQILLGDKFCGSCGFKVEEVPVSEIIETKTCSICEEQVPVSAIFCGCCGSHLVG